MTAPDPRLDEIQARLEPALFHAPYIVDGRRVIQANNHPAIAPYMLSDNSMPVIAEFIANAPADLAYLLAELRKAHEALERVEALHKRVEGYQFGAIPGAEPDWPVCSTCFTEDEHPQPWPCPTAAAVAAAKGDGE